jgi:hypothetical protein
MLWQVVASFPNSCCLLFRLPMRSRADSDQTEYAENPCLSNGVSEERLQYMGVSCTSKGVGDKPQPPSATDVGRHPERSTLYVHHGFAAYLPLPGEKSADPSAVYAIP